MRALTSRYKLRDLRLYAWADVTSAGLHYVREDPRRTGLVLHMKDGTSILLLEAFLFREPHGWIAHILDGLNAGFSGIAPPLTRDAFTAACIGGRSAG